MQATVEGPEAVEHTHRPAPRSSPPVSGGCENTLVDGYSQQGKDCEDSPYSQHRFWDSFAKGPACMNEYILAPSGGYLEYVIPSAKRCNVHFPNDTAFNGPTMDSLLSGAKRGAKASNGVGGVAPEGCLPPTPSSKTKLLWGLFRQSGRPKPRLDALVVHPQGFRILKARSAVERSLRSYFRLPPAPSERLRRERVLSQRLLLVSDMRDDEEDARVFNAAMEGKLRPQQVGAHVSPPNMMLDGFLLLCAGGVPEPEAVKSATLQGSSLVGVISDDMAHFGNLSFLDVSENKLQLEQLLVLTGLEVLHLACNQITSLAGLAAVVQDSLKRSMGNDSSGKLGFGGTQRGEAMDSTGPESSSIRSAAAYYARENVVEIPSTDMEDEEFSSENVGPPPPNVSGRRETFSGYVRERSPGKAFDPIARIMEGSTHDVLLPNLHTLNLSFNRIAPSDILQLSYFPSLERLDLSGNKLCKLPEDLACLTSVTHFALEGNMFRDGGNVFRALSTMPALVEVNLNHNKLRRVPPMSVKDGHGLCFPSIEVIGLGHNCVEKAQDVAALSELQHSLVRVILTGNPIATNQKQRRAARAHFVQSVLSHYWKQVGARDSTRNQGRHDNFSFYGTDTFDDIGMSQFQHGGRRETQGRKDTESEEMPMDERYGEGSQGFSVWNSGTRPGSVNQKPHRYDVAEDSGDQVAATEDGDAGMEYSYDNSVERSRVCKESSRIGSACASSACSGSLGGDICWYGDAPMPQSFDKDKDTSMPILPSMSSFRVVELVFEDTCMPKRKAVQFYGKKLPQHGGDVAVSSMVHPRTGLVTVPKHEEYMDVHRLVKTSARDGPKQPYRTRKDKSKGDLAHILLPTEDDGDENDMDEVEPPVETRVEEDEEEGTDTSSDEAALPQDGVFMTGVALEGRREKKPKKVKKKEEQQRLEPEEAEGDTERQDSTSPAQQHIPQPPPRRSQRKAPGCRREAGTVRTGRVPQLVVEPPGTNARILMNELRRMLRRPLPPLPPVCMTRTGGK